MEKIKMPENKDMWFRFLPHSIGFILFTIAMYLMFGNDLKWCILLLLSVLIYHGFLLINRRNQKKTEERENMEKVLKHREDLFRGIFNNAAAGIALLNQEGYYQHANVTLCRMLGYSEEELQTMKFHDLTYPEDIEESVRLSEEIWQGNVPWMNSEKRYICKNGEVLWTEINLSAIRGEDRKITDIIVVVLDITVRKRMEQELLQQATTDFLTGVDNRLAFMQKGQEEFNRAHRYNRNFAMLLLDVDKFKCVNDIFGHLIGDRVLRDVVKACKEALRDTDILARIGGEEFAILLIESDLETAYQVALRVQQKVKEVTVESEDSEIQVTVSIGISMQRDEDNTLDDIFKRADDALYQAKNSGRNRIVVESIR